jgi:hypothetical protein
MSEDIEMIERDLQFKLKKIVDIKTTAHKVIGEPIPYSDFK